VTAPVTPSTMNEALVPSGSHAQALLLSSWGTKMHQDACDLGGALRD
jgi:hypothetical protein